MTQQLIDLENWLKENPVRHWLKVTDEYGNNIRIKFFLKHLEKHVNLETYIKSIFKKGYDQVIIEKREKHGSSAKTIGGTYTVKNSQKSVVGGEAASVGNNSNAQSFNNHQNTNAMQGLSGTQGLNGADLINHVAKSQNHDRVQKEYDELKAKHDRIKERLEDKIDRLKENHEAKVTKLKDQLDDLKRDKTPSAISDLISSFTKNPELLQMVGSGVIQSKQAQASQPKQGLSGVEKLSPRAQYFLNLLMNEPPSDDILDRAILVVKYYKANNTEFINTLEPLFEKGIQQNKQK